MTMIDDDEMILLMVEAEVERHQARSRAKRIIDAARHQYKRYQCRRRGIPVDSTRCDLLMARAEDVIWRQIESTHRPRPRTLGELHRSNANHQLLTEAPAADDEASLGAPRVCGRSRLR
jgi:hypothetical protein